MFMTSRTLVQPKHNQLHARDGVPQMYWLATCSL